VVTGAAVPTTAERVRTVCARAQTARLVADGAPTVASPVHHLFACGHIALTVHSRSAHAAMPAGTPVVIELLDHGPDPGDEAVRSLVWVRGRLRHIEPFRVCAVLDAIAAASPNPALLDVGHRDRLLLVSVQSTVFADATGADSVDRSALLEARPDPFCHLESAWVQHLHDRHPELVERLRSQLPRGMRRGRLRLVGLDRYGLQVRVDGPDGRFDVRVPFARPVADGAALARALRSLMGCPFNRGLQKRPG
jgi:hypothetical protein